MRRVRQGDYDGVPEFEAIVSQLEKALGSVSKAIPFEELCTVIDSRYDALECKDLATYLVKVPDIHKRGYGTSILSTDPDALALMDPTDSVKINARVNGAFGLLASDQQREAGGRGGDASSNFCHRPNRGNGTGT